MEEQLRILLQDTINENLYQIILSNPRDKEKAFKIKVRPVMVKGEILYQKTVYEGTKVFHGNEKADAIIACIGREITENFKQCEIEHRSRKATILVSKKGKMTIKEKKLAMTGEISLRGDVLPIGGLPEKLMAAQRAGIQTVLIPAQNEEDLKDVAQEIKDKLTIIPVATIQEVVKESLGVEI